MGVPKPFLMRGHFRFAILLPGQTPDAPVTGAEKADRVAPMSSVPFRWGTFPLWATRLQHDGTDLFRLRWDSATERALVKAASDRCAVPSAGIHVRALRGRNWSGFAARIGCGPYGRPRPLSSDRSRPGGICWATSMRRSPPPYRQPGIVDGSWTNDKRSVAEKPACRESRNSRELRSGRRILRGR